MIDKWFLNFTKEGGPSRKGIIVSQVEPGIYLVLLKDDDSDHPGVLKLVSISTMLGWLLFDTLVDLDKYYKIHYSEDRDITKDNKLSINLDIKTIEKEEKDKESKDAKTR